MIRCIGETVTISSDPSQPAAAFAAGALQALKWAKGKPAGIYTMRHVLGFD